jgi:S1-C subfamily serine protease
VELTYLRGQERRKTDVQLADSGDTQTASREIDASDALAGVRLSQLDQSHPAWGNVDGVVVSDVAPGSRAAGAGLQAGDVITAVNMKAVDSLSAIDRALENASGALAVSVWRDGRQVLIVIRS